VHRDLQQEDPKAAQGGLTPVRVAVVLTRTSETESSPVRRVIGTLQSPVSVAGRSKRTRWTSFVRRRFLQ
jgi:hypothetical protein